MLNSIQFKIRAHVDTDKIRILELFFKDWVDSSCNNEVQYRIERSPELVFSNKHKSHEIFNVEFEKQEDALALKLKGVPYEFQNYLEIVN